jgi:hypothetical protein
MLARKFEHRQQMRENVEARSKEVLEKTHKHVSGAVEHTTSNLSSRLENKAEILVAVLLRAWAQFDRMWSLEVMSECYAALKEPLRYKRAKALCNKWKLRRMIRIANRFLAIERMMPTYYRLRFLRSVFWSWMRVVATTIARVRPSFTSMIRRRRHRVLFFSRLIVAGRASSCPRCLFARWLEYLHLRVIKRSLVASSREMLAARWMGRCFYAWRTGKCASAYNQSPTPESKDVYDERLAALTHTDYVPGHIHAMASPEVLEALALLIGAVNPAEGLGGEPGPVGPVGSRWKKVGREPPRKGSELVSETLGAALRTRSGPEDEGPCVQVFSQKELADLSLPEDLRTDSFIKVDGRYFEQAAGSMVPALRSYPPWARVVYGGQRELSAALELDKWVLTLSRAAESHAGWLRRKSCWVRRRTIKHTSQSKMRKLLLAVFEDLFERIKHEAELHFKEAENPDAMPSAYLSGALQLREYELKALWAAGMSMAKALVYAEENEIPTGLEPLAKPLIAVGIGRWMANSLSYGLPRVHALDPATREPTNKLSRLPQPNDGPLAQKYWRHYDFLILQAKERSQAAGRRKPS